MSKYHLLGLFPAAAALALVTGCSQTTHSDGTKAADEVKANMTELVAAFVAGDADKAVSWDAPDFVGMYHGTPNVVGQEADRVVTKQQGADPALKLSVSDPVVDAAASGDLVVWRATYNYTYTDPATKQPKTEVGNWLVGWKRAADGKMQEVWSVVSDTPAPAAVAPPA